MRRFWTLLAAVISVSWLWLVLDLVRASSLIDSPSRRSTFTVASVVACRSVLAPSNSATVIIWAGGEIDQIEGSISVGGFYLRG